MKIAPKLEDRHSWNRHWFEVQIYFIDNGHCKIPQSYKVRGLSVGQWLATQKSRANNDPNYPADQRALMVELGVELKIIDALKEVYTKQWQDRGWEEMSAFVQVNGHAKILPGTKVPSGFPISTWADSQRRLSEKDDYPKDRRKFLDAHHFFWSLHDAMFEEGFNYLEKFEMEFGHCRVNYRYRTKNDFQLGVWVLGQRQDARNLAWYSPVRKARLNDLGFVWDARHENSSNNSVVAFQNGISLLTNFSNIFGHCVVTRYHVSPDWERLKKWSKAERGRSKSPEYPDERRAKLDELGFIWDAKQAQMKFEHGIEELQLYRVKFGHCSVPLDFVSSRGVAVGEWLQLQKFRAEKNDFDGDRRSALGELGIYLKRPAKNDTFESRAAELKILREQNGDDEVPEGSDISIWYQNQIWAAGEGFLDPAQIQTLVELGLLDNPGESRPRLR